MKVYAFTNLLLTAFPVLAHETTRKRNGGLQRFSTGANDRDVQSAIIMNTNQVERDLAESMSMVQSMSTDYAKDPFWDLNDVILNPCGCPDRDGTFCGNDGKCHDYTCESFYEFGPEDFTGYGPQAPELKCVDIPVTNVDMDHGSWHEKGVLFRCEDLTPKPIAMGYTKYCEASTSNGNFTCYGVSENTGYNVFNDFLQRAQAAELECSQYNETPAYVYQATNVKRDGPSLKTFAMDGDQWGNDVFNYTKAVISTMSSQFETPTNHEPNDDNISASNIASSWLALLGVAFMTLF